ncbi:hemophore-related protein [Nocardia blacklockiae]|uniref:hemophore-related protein n=1 Tax=Nocardia blacklockiae TaxID=480036 RepID=UPI001895D49E|nr:hemophore-related protein [Nocardia blacklockiae]MBF6175210.1 hemophore-related protein [Nocardia blacklockiae]
MSVTRFMRGSLLVAAACAGVVTVAGTASAQPGERHPLAESTCSAAQVEAAMRDHAPQFAAYLDEHPDHRAKFEHMFSVPPEQRRIVIRERGEDGPPPGEGRDRIILRDDPRFAGLPQQMRVVADTCHQY